MSAALHRTNHAAGSLRALVVDDDSVYRRILVHSLHRIGVVSVESASDIGIARNKIEREPFDIVTIDVVLRGESGLDLLAWLRARRPEIVPVLVTSGAEATARSAVDALLLGAAALILKPGGPTASAQLDTALADVLAGIASCHAPAPPPPPAHVAPELLLPARRDVVLIGASTGGPAAVLDLLRGLPETFATPVLIAQHMLPHHLEHFAQLLASRTRRAISIAPDGETPKPGHVYIAPGDKHLVLERQAGQLVMVHDSGPPEHHCRPAVDPLFRSAAHTCGPAAIAAVLTGMGNDAALGAVALRKRGAPVAAQDRESSVVWGMPGAVVAQGAADLVAPVGEIARWIASLDAGQPTRRTK